MAEKRKQKFSTEILMSIRNVQEILIRLPPLGTPVHSLSLTDTLMHCRTPLG